MIYIFTRYGRLGASSRIRTLQYFDKGNILLPRKILINSLISNKQLAHKYKKKSYQIISLIFAYLERLLKLIIAKKTDLFYIEKELFPIFPYFIESFFLNKKKYILNYDDAVFDYYESNKNFLVRFFLKNKHKLLIKNSFLTICGNEFLQNYAEDAGCKNIKIMPSVIDIKKYKINNTKNIIPVICWIGSNSTIHNLEILNPVFLKLAKEKEFILKIIGSDQFSIKGINCITIKWSEDTEISELSNSDIGIMPLIKTRFALGKCGYKLIQYMGVGIPVVASNIGVNNKIVKNSENGFLADTQNDWFYYLKILLENHNLRDRLGRNGRKMVKDRYSVKITEKTFISFFNE